MTQGEYDKRSSDPRSLGRVIRDPVHNYVHLPTEFNRLTAHPFIQRLRCISQTSFATSVYPSMTGSRFEHTLGTMHLAGIAWDRLWANSQSHAATLLSQIQKDTISAHDNGEPVDRSSLKTLGLKDSSLDAPHALRLAVQTVALTHDIGHPPFSHALENFYLRHLPEITNEAWIRDVWNGVVSGANGSGLPMHEVASRLLFDQLGPSVSEPLPWWVARAILTDRFGWSAALHKLISASIDVDRLDYLMRDSRLAGTEFGSLDSQRLLDSLELHLDNGQWVVGFGVRAASAIETFFTPSVSRRSRRHRSMG